MEETPAEYVMRLVEVFREVKRVLRDDGTLWLNLGDSYVGTGDKGTYRDPKYAQGRNGQAVARNRKVAGLPAKNLMGIPWRVAFALQEDGWILRSDIIWTKGNPLPESVKDRPTRSHEYIFLFSKQPRYYYDAEAIAEPAVARNSHDYTGSSYKAPGQPRQTGSRDNLSLVGKQRSATFKWDPQTIQALTRNRRSVWHVNTKPYPGSHFAVFPEQLVEPMILAGCPAAGKRCDCDEVIKTPVGEGIVEDPTQLTGRAGFNRPRREGEGSRPITRREQRWEADLMRHSPYKEAMRDLCGDAFDHYIRTDRAGARPLPSAIRDDFFARGWLTVAPPCPHPIEEAGIVLDPFAGSGTTLAVARRLGRRAIGIELNAAYLPLIQQRLAEQGLFAL